MEELKAFDITETEWILTTKSGRKIKCHAFTDENGVNFLDLRGSYLDTGDEVIIPVSVVEYVWDKQEENNKWEYHSEETFE